MINWLIEIDQMAAAKQVLREADIERLWRYEGPNPAAPEQAIRAVEDRLGRDLDGQLVTFLRHANGWPAILQDVDLFGTEEFLSPRFDEARELLATIEPEVATASGIDFGSAIPIGASATGIDMFVMPVAPGDEPSQVVWIAGVEVERYETFDAFFRGMIASNLDEASELRAQAP